MRRMLLRGLTSGLILAALGCGSEGPASPADGTTGTWTLRTVDGAPLPIVLSVSNGTTRTLLSEELILTAAGSVRRNRSTRESTAAGTSSFVVAELGSFSVTNSVVTFPFGTGSLANGALTITLDSRLHVYRRE